MKKKLKIFGLMALMLAPVIAYAASETRLGYDKVTIGNSTAVNKEQRFNINLGSANPGLRGNTATSKIEFSHDGSVWKAIGSGGGAGGGGVVLNENFGFEDGATGWTASGGTFAITSTAADVGFGLNAASWTPSALNQTLSYSALTLPAGLYGKVCSISWYYKGADANYVFEVTDGTNTLATSSATSTQSIYSAKQALYFTCPASGSVIPRVRAISASPAQIFVDDFKIGQETLFEVSSAEQVADAFIAGTASCNLTRTNTAFGPFGAQAACPGPTVVRGNVSTADTDLPRFTVSNLVPGTYRVTMTASAFNNSGAQSYGLAINDGTDTRGQIHSQGSTSQAFTIVAVFSYSTFQSSKTFEIYAADTGATVTLTNAVATGKINFLLEKFPVNSEQAISIDKTGWRIDANIGGANASLGSSSVTSYSPILDAGLDMVLASGSATAEIPCASGTASTGLTCTAANESIGIAFTPPTAGSYDVCMTFPHYIQTNSSATLIAAWQLAETSNTATTIIQEGGERTNSGMAPGVGTNLYIPVKVCGNFNFSDTSKRTIRLMYELDAGATITDNHVRIDRNASTGQRDLKITVRRRVEFADAIKFTNLATTPIATGIKIATAKITTAAGPTCTVNSESGDWLGATTAHATGQCSIVINANIFSQTPHCFCNVYGNSAESCNITDATALSNTLVRLNRFTSTSGTNIDGAMHIQCVGF